MLYSVVVQSNLYMYEVCFIYKFCEEVFLCFSCLLFERLQNKISDDLHIICTTDVVVG